MIKELCFKPECRGINLLNMFQCIFPTGDQTSFFDIPHDTFFYLFEYTEESQVNLL